MILKLHPQNHGESLAVNVVLFYQPLFDIQPFPAYGEAFSSASCTTKYIRRKTEADRQ